MPLFPTISPWNCFFSHERDSVFFFTFLEFLKSWCQSDSLFTYMKNRELCLTVQKKSDASIVARNLILKQSKYSEKFFLLFIPSELYSWPVMSVPSSSSSSSSSSKGIEGEKPGGTSPSPIEGVEVSIAGPSTLENPVCPLPQDAESEDYGNEADEEGEDSSEEESEVNANSVIFQ